MKVRKYESTSEGTEVRKYESTKYESTSEGTRVLPYVYTHAYYCGVK
jgi:hypothetical protein